MITWLVEAVAPPVSKGSVPHSSGKTSGPGLTVAARFRPESKLLEKAKAARCLQGQVKMSSQEVKARIRSGDSNEDQTQHSDCRAGP